VANQHWGVMGLEPSNGLRPSCCSYGVYSHTYSH
jgi:hypothetical protein